MVCEYTYTCMQLCVPLQYHPHTVHADTTSQCPDHPPLAHPQHQNGAAVYPPPHVAPHPPHHVASEPCFAHPHAPFSGGAKAPPESTMNGSSMALDEAAGEESVRHNNGCNGHDAMGDGHATDGPQSIKQDQGRRYPRQSAWNGNKETTGRQGSDVCMQDATLGGAPGRASATAVAQAFEVCDVGYLSLLSVPIIIISPSIPTTTAKLSCVEWQHGNTPAIPTHPRTAAPPRLNSAAHAAAQDTPQL